MRKVYKKKYKNKLADSIMPFSFLISFFVYIGTSNLQLSIIIFFFSLACFIAFLFWKSNMKRKRLLDSGIYIVDKMSGDQFEEFLLAHFEALGYSGYVTRGSQDYGADVVIKKNGVITVVQAKRWMQKVSVDAVQQITAAVNHYKAHKALVITNNYFTGNAFKLANSNRVELWDRNKLIEKLIERKLSPDAALAIEAEKDTCPVCGKNLIERNGKKGCFLGCSGFPQCKYTKSI